MTFKNISSVAIRVWLGLLFYALQYDYGNWATYQTMLQMTGNSFFIIGIVYLFMGWGNVIYENSHGKNWIEAQFIPNEIGSDRKWIWFISSLFFLLPAIIITFYISFIKG